MIYTLVEYCATILDVFFLVWFIPKFNFKTWNKNKKTFWIPVLILIFQFIGDRYLAGYNAIYSLIFIISVSVYSCILSDRHYFRALLGASLYIVTVVLVSGLLSSFFSIYINDFDNIIQGANTDVRLIFLVIGKVIQFIFYKLFLYIFRAEEILDWKNSILVYLTTIMTVVGLCALMSVIMIAETKRMRIEILVTVFVLIFTNCAMYFLIYQVQKLLKSEYELKLLQEKMDFEKSRYEEATVVWDNIRKVRHDIKNHFAVILGHLKKEDTKSCEEYIEKIMPSVESMGNLIRSNNSVLDYLINSKLAGLKETQIVISGIVSNFDDVEDTDLASVIGNILDNAVEAQERVTGTKRIELMFRMMNDNRVIICKNAISESVLKTNKELRSTKKNHNDHGLGHQIVETILKKYDGWVDYFESEDMFGVQIMLPMPRQNNIS